MLGELNINNIALIKRSDIEFEKGLNVLSGETGAGKSMVIGSLEFALGGRATRDFVREGEEKATVEAVFYDVSEQVLKCAAEMGVDCEDKTIILQRTINKFGRTSGRINGVTATASMLKNIAEKLIDIHSQHESHSLLNSANHIDVLDRFCMPEILGLKSELSELIYKYKKIREKLKAVSGDENERKRRIELLEYKIYEIEQADLSSDEEEKLNLRKKTLLSAEKLIKHSSQCLALLYYGGEGDLSAIDRLSAALKLCGSMVANDESLSDVYENIDELYSKLQYTSDRLKSYLDDINADPNEINKIEERLDLIYNIKKKYGADFNEIMENLKKAKEELDFINNSEEIRLKLNAENDKIINSIKNICDKITDIRKNAAKKLQKRITEELRDLEMKNAIFEVYITQKDSFNSKGRDNVEFMISTNAGESLKPLSTTASGGEMSRVMLGLKTVISGNENIDTFVFDEIDTGISGRTATKVAEKMAYISNKQQILCITHLPQIEAISDKSFLIEKSVESEKTVTKVKELNYNDKVSEVLRLMGSNTTDAGIKAAKEMINFSDERKKAIRG